jgi:hypothetical protein
MSPRRIDGRKARTPYAVGAGALAAAAVAMTVVSGCASQKLSPQTETVSTSNAAAAAAVVAAQTSSCPADKPTSLASNVSGLTTQLEPLDATRVLLCVYASQLNIVSSAGASDSTSSDTGSSDSSSASASSAAPRAVTLTDASAISTLRSGLNALAAPPSTPVNCPNDTGAAVLGIFTNGSQETEVLMTTTGCPEVSNGQKTGWVGSSDFGSVLSAVLRAA